MLKIFVLLALLFTAQAFTVTPQRRFGTQLHAGEKQEAVKKADFVAAVASKSGLSKTDAESALAAVIDTITTEVSSGKKISMLGFGTFKSTFRSARTGRNPKTGEPLEIKAQWSPVFSASKTFKEKCNPPQ
ncbi:hypothetical protein TrVE_jg2093 [Triparma verrucosa]|uniref:Uncharacterized protein n=1 Tax=Triparma verrucosa TaxID=1606542 RepID=A0A9W7FAD5_9STRA|nr:hypothetical protein TrVE_jg2093 [Triparma verrucosa]